NTQDDLEQGGFATAVRSDYCQEILLLHPQVDVCQDGIAVIEKRDIVQLNSRNGHIRSLPIACQEWLKSAQPPAGGFFPSRAPGRRPGPTCPQPRRLWSGRSWANIAAERIWLLFQARERVL